MPKSLDCKQCGGQMKRSTKAEKNYAAQVFGVIVFIVGFVLLFMFPIGTIIGVLLMIAAARMGYKKRNIWECTSCGYFFERV